MRYILTPNLEPPYNLVRIAPAYGGQEFVGWTEDEVIEAAIKRNIEAGIIPSGASYWIVDEVDLPSGEYFFDAWEYDNGVQVNMSRARDIHMSYIRKCRDAELVRLDVPFLRAIESGETAEQKRIAVVKQRLRDIPLTFDLASYSTPDTLERAWPERLTKLVTVCKTKDK